MNQTQTRILQMANELEPQIVQFMLAVLRIQSFSAKEEQVVTRIIQEMQTLGFDEARRDGLGNVIGRIGSGPRVIAFDAHIDTVYPGDLEQWSFDPFQPKLADGKIWGRGAADQKGGLVSMVYAAKIIQALGLNREFTLLFTGTVQEEDCDGMCWQYLVEKEGLKPELVVITEPTSLNIYRGHRGRMEIEVHVKGRSCHGSAPERGDNAIYKIARVALEIEKLNARLASDPFLGKGTVTVSEVASGSPSLCAVADSARLYLDRRLTLGETKESSLAEVQDAARRAGYPEAAVAVPGYAVPSYTGAVFATEKYYPTWVTAADSPHLQAAAAAYQGLFAKAPLIDKWTFSTNGVGIAPRYGIPCFGLGPGHEAQAHSVDEYCPVDHLRLAAAFYAGFIAQLQQG
jgi:putative selenium metabolism hydrolase